MLLPELCALSLTKSVNRERLIGVLLERSDLGLAVSKFGEGILIEFREVALWLVEVKIS